MSSEPTIPPLTSFENSNGTSSFPEKKSETFVSNIKMSTYNHSSSYNRTYERKVVEEAPTAIRYQSPIHEFQSRIPFPTGFSDIKTVPSSFVNAHDYKFGTSTSGSFHSSEDSIHVTMDVSAFAPEDLNVSVVGSYIVIEGRHAEKPDELGLIERHFIRKFPLPRLVHPDSVTSNLTSDGQLTIKADPPKPKGDSPARTIPIKIVTTGNTPNPSSQTSPAPSQTNGAEKL
uniref:SHSP domain-containing protein n=1 Tax=Acrobeloides nanus TaxID=290746 RepID=A0A914DN43_9BILA